MKKIVSIMLMWLAVFSLNAYALDSKVLDMRNKFFEESKAIKLILPHSQDAALLTSMFDSCIMAASQYDAYFFMLGIFEVIKKDEATTSSADLLIGWLRQIKGTNDLSIKSMVSINIPLEVDTKANVAKMITYFAESNNRIDLEIKKIENIKQSLKIPATASEKPKAKAKK